MDNNTPGISRAQRRKAEQHRHKLAAPFFFALFLLTLISFIIPLRPTQSMTEKRNLARFPEFSMHALLSGDYFDGISTWFSDTFPGRESWLSVNTALGNLHGISTNVVDYSRLGKADDIPDVIPESAAAPAAASTPRPTASLPVPSPVPTPEVVLTAPPEESVEQWGGLGVSGDEELIFGTALQIGDTAFDYYGFSQDLADRRASLVNRCAEAIEPYGAQLVDIPIPSSIGVTLSSDLLEKLNSSDQGKAISYIFSLENDSVCKVNTFNNLVEHNSEYIYFRTDHHWTALGAYYAYEQFCRVVGFEPVSLDEYTAVDMGEFLGSHYYSSPQPGTLRPDTLIAYEPPGDLTMLISNEGGATFEWPVVSDLSSANIGAKYTAFIAGDNPMTVITNNALPDAPNCVILKDSFGNPFSIFLAQHYHNVYILDYRLYHTPMSSFVQTYSVRDVILADSLSMNQGSNVNDLLSFLLG